jgi:putative nucleotidyltransferase with HDIG domain
VLLAEPPTVTHNSSPRAGSHECPRHPGDRTRDTRSGRLPEPSADLPAGTVRWVLVATGLVAVLPAAVTWWLRSSGIVSSPFVSAAAGLCISLVVSWWARRFWQTRPGSRDLLFSELMIWGYVRRRATERRLASARKLLGAAATRQSSSAEGMNADRQAKLLERLARSLDTRDHATYGHSRRVARYASMIAGRMELPREQVARVRTAAAIHDIGKIETPDSVLKKPGALTDDEYEVMKLHAAAGSEMASVLHDPELSRFIRSHHERMDGSGYPDALVGERIPIGARIIAVADTFDALTANRPYRTARTHREALDLLKREAEGKLDPHAVRAFREVYSGRRSLALWASITSLPERVLAQLTGDAAGAASAAKGAALGAIATALATTSAVALAHPPTKAGRKAVPTGRAVTFVTATYGRRQQIASHGRAIQASAHPVEDRRHERRVGQRATLYTDSSRTAAAANRNQPAATTAPRPSEAPRPAPGGEDPAERRRVVQQPGTPKPAETSRSVERPDAPSTGDTHEPADKGEAREPSQGPQGKVEEVVKGKVEEVKGKVGEVKGKVEETVKGTVEEAKGKVEETKGKVEEVVKGKVEEVKGKVEEAKGKVEETIKGKVEEIAKGKI